MGMKDSYPLEYAMLCELIGEPIPGYSDGFYWGSSMPPQTRTIQNYCAAEWHLVIRPPRELISLDADSWWFFDGDTMSNYTKMESFGDIVEYLKLPSVRSRHNLPPLEDAA